MHYLPSAHFFPQFYDGPSADVGEISKVCGDELPAPVESTGNVMTVVFSTDFSVTDTGFLLQWDEVGPTTGIGNLFPNLPTNS